jgi:hypothetical protein
MLSETTIKNMLVIKIESLKDSFEDDDLEYMKIDEIKLCQEDSIWGNYNQFVISKMSQIRLITHILELTDEELEKIFDDIKRR